MSKTWPFKSYFSLLIVCCFSLCQNVWGAPRKVEGLFDQDADQVLVLNATNFEEYLNGSSQYSVVLYYSSYCGHCKRFKGPYVDAALELQDMRKKVVITAINCADPFNAETCSKNDIHGYPTVKLHAPKNKGVPFKMERINSDPTIPNVLEKIGDALKLDSAGLTWEKFLKARSHVRSKKRSLVTLVQKQGESDLKIRMNLALYSIPYRGVEFNSVNITNEKETESLKELLQSNGIKSDIKYPMLLFTSWDDIESKVKDVLLRAGGNQVYEFSGTLKPNMADLYRKGPSLDDIFFTGLGNNNRLASTDERIKKIFENRKKDAIYMEDLVSAVLQTINDEVPTNVPFTKESKEAFLAFLDVVAKHFPDANGEGAKDFYTPGIIKNFALRMKSALVANEPKTFQEYKTLVASTFKEASDGKELWAPSYVGCQGSEPTFRGYPCSMWTLFHTLQISANSDDESDTSVLVAMVKYIPSFFSCIECRENFIKESSGYKDYIEDSRTSILYLWKLHNSVNDRLAGDVTEDPTHKKVQFPSYKQCSACYMSKPDLHTEPEDIEWNKKEVFSFLKKYYGSDNIRSMDAQMKHQDG